MSIFANIADGIGNPDRSTSLLTHIERREKSAGHNGIHIHSLNRTEVETALQNLSTRKRTGWDGIPPKALKVAANEIARPPTTLYNACIAEGEWPTA